MGSHSLQAVAVVLFLLAAVVLCAGLAVGGSIPLLAAGAAALALSVVLFRRCKQLEEGSRS